MTVEDLIEALRQLPESAKTAQVWYPCIVVEHSEEEKCVTVEEVKYDRGAVVIR